MGATPDHSIINKRGKEMIKVGSGQVTDALLYIPKEPPIAQMPDHRERIHNFTPADERETKEGCASNNLRVVQVPIVHHKTKQKAARMSTTAHKDVERNREQVTKSDSPINS